MTKKKTNAPASHHYDLTQPEVKSIYDSAYAKGQADKETQIYLAVEALDADAFDELLYKKDVLELIKTAAKYPLPLPPKTADNTEAAILSRPEKFKKENK